MHGFADGDTGAAKSPGRWRRGLAATALAGLTLAVTACGSSGTATQQDTASAGATGSSTAAATTGSSSGATSGVAEAQKMVQSSLGDVVWKGPYDKIDVSGLRGKTIWAVNLDLSIPHMKTIGESLTQAASAAGVKVVMFDGKSQVSEWSRGIQQAIAAKAAAIVPLAITLDTVKAPLQQAKAAGIPIIAGLYTDAGEPVPPAFKDIVAGQVTEQYYRAGQLEAAWVVQDSGGKADVLAIDAPGISVSKPVVDGIKDVFAKTCPDCKVTWAHSPTSQWSTQLGTNVRTALTNNPKLNYVVPVFDGMSTFIVPAIHQAGAQGRVKVSTYNATAAILKMLAAGDVVGADSGTQGPWEGWALADASFRAMLGKKVPANYQIPLRLFTKENIGSIDISKGEGAWYGPLDFEAKFKALWGVQ